MTKHSYVFTEIDSSIKIPVRMVRMGNGEMVKFEGKGTIAMEKKRTCQINDVLYVPNLDQNYSAFLK